MRNLEISLWSRLNICVISIGLGFFKVMRIL